MEISRTSDDAVSSIAATALLVALTIVAIAIAALVVTGIAGGYGNEKSVDIRVWPSGDETISVVITGGPDTVSLLSLRASAENVVFVHDGVINNPKVGLPDTLTVVSGLPPGNNVLLTLTGTFSDGTIQVVYQGRLNV